MIKRARYIALLCCVLAVQHAFAQADVHFSQFYETSILRNPALTGIFQVDYKFSAYYRNQWNSITDPYETALINAESKIRVSENSHDLLSFGVTGYYDKAGALSQKIAAVYPAINYNKSLDAEKHTYLSLGLAAGYLQYAYEPSKATFNNQFVGGVFNVANPSFDALPNSKISVFDLGIGVNFNSTAGIEERVTYMIGASAYHFTQPRFSYYNTGNVTMNTRWNINAGMIWEITDISILQVHANYQQQGMYREMIGGALIGWRKLEAGNPIFELYTGAFYRFADAIIPAVKLKFKGFTLGVSYDVNVSGLKPASNLQGGPEFTISFGGPPPGPEPYASTVCPRF